jgi:hypothetical protein
VLDDARIKTCALRRCHRRNLIRSSSAVA